MGMVYAARQASIDRTVAIKMLKPGSEQDKTKRNKFIAEAAVTGGLTGGDEVVVEGTSQGLKRTAARFFHTFNEHYARRRAEWLSGFVERELLGPVLSELREGAQVVETEAFRNVERALKELKGFARPGSLPERVVETRRSQSPGGSQHGGTS